MGTSRRELALTTEEDLLAAQHRFASGNEAPSAQLRAKRAEKADQSRKASGKQKVSWDPELREGSGGAPISKGSEHSAEHGETSSETGNESFLRPRQAVSSLSGGSNLAEQAHPRIGPGTDLAAEDDDDDSDDESGGGQEGLNLPPYQPLLTVGFIKEKGFSGEKLTAVTLPSARVTSFPEARHRSDGPVRQTNFC